jgi:hypothetical protein
MLPMPTERWLRPVRSAWRVGEQRAAVWNRVYRRPFAASRSSVGVRQGPPKTLDEPNPASSIRTISIGSTRVLPFAPIPWLEVREESTLAGRAVRIIGKEFEVAFDRDAGLLRRGVAASEALLLESPALHVMQTGRPLSPIPDRLTWKPKGLQVRRAGEDVVVEIEGSYPSFEGGYTFRVTPGGEIEAAGRFVYTGEDLRAKEVGLRFSVPREADRLRWERKAEWRVYPPDHIGRPLGEARAFPEHGSALPPTWSWSEDSTPLGSNDFRSVKRRIHWAAIGYPAGPAVTVESDGRQSVRAIVEGDRISVHVLDWYGGTGVQAWEWVHNYGEGRLIKKGERIEVSARLRFSR